MATDTNNKTKIERWLRPLLFPFDSDEIPRPDRIIIKHVKVNDRLEEIRTVKLAADLDENSMIAVIGNFEEAMIDDAEGIGGVQRYQLHAMDKKTQVSRLSLRYRASFKDEEDVASDSEPATEKGALAQMMRHLEVRDRIYNMGFGQLIQSQAAMLESRERMLNEYAGRFLEVETAYHELISMKHARDMDEKRLEATTEMKQRAIQKLLVLVPPIAKKLGLSGVKDETNIDVEEMRGVLESLDESQLEAMSRVLRPEQMFAVASLMQKDIERVSQGGPKRNGLVPKVKS